MRSTASRRRSPSGRKTPRRNPRSTVATSTECYDFLRLLYARVGQTFCPNCGTRVRKDTVDEVAARLLAIAAPARAGTRCFRCGEHAGAQALRDHLFELRKKGFNRLFQGGKIFEFSTPESLLDIDFSKPRVPPGGSHRHRRPTCTSGWSTPSKSATAKPAK